jgi:histidinol-phosphatase (PHP family)
MEEMCRAALSAGLTEIGFTEHFDLIPEDPCYAFFETDIWWEHLERCRRMFDDHLVIKAGIEIGEPHRFTEEVETLLENHAWDFSLASLHWVEDELIFEPAYYQQGASEAYRRYFSELLEMVQESKCDIVAHADIVKRYGFDHYGPFHPQQYEAEIRAVLRACAVSGMALEINTSTLRRPIKQPSPNKEIVRWFYEEGGRHITLGSDAHHPDQIAYGLEAIVHWLPETGFDHLASYTLRQPQAVPLAGGAG